MATLHLRKFNPRTLPFSYNDDNSKAPTIVIIGRRATGKTYLIKDLLSNFQTIPVATVVTGADRATYSQFIPSVFIYNTYDQEITKRVLLRQEKCLEQAKPDQDSRTMVVFDDCFLNNKWSKDKHMRNLFLNARHMKAMPIFSMQYPLDLPPMFRTNIDYTFIFGETEKTCLNKIYQIYGSIFPSFIAFCAVLEQVSENHGCLVIHNSSQSHKLEDIVFWYQVTETHPNLKLCDNKFWELSKILETLPIKGTVLSLGEWTNTTVIEPDQPDETNNILVEPGNDTPMADIELDRNPAPIATESVTDEQILELDTNVGLR